MKRTNRTLVVIRHAKAETVAPEDWRRRLARRGVDDARHLGEWLRGRDVQPDLALVSSAVRTVQTWDALADAAGWTRKASEVDALYSAGTDAVLELLADANPKARTVVVVGHNPTMGSLSQQLSGDDPDPDAFRVLVRGFPTSATAVFEVPGSWRKLAPGTLRLAAAWTPAG